MAYKMTHPASKNEIEVSAEMVKTYESQGWETKPTVKAPAPADEQKKK